GPVLEHLLEPAELGDVELRVGDGPVVAEEDADLGVPLDPGHRVDHDALGHCGPLGVLIPSYTRVNGLPDRWSIVDQGCQGCQRFSHPPGTLARKPDPGRRAPETDRTLAP